MADWQPTATLETLRRRAELMAAIRHFFALRSVWEVDVPVLAKTGVTDLNIDSIPAELNGRRHYLQSSPEYQMKRLLAAGSGGIYYLGKAFRNGESGRRHSPEFTLLEWYRPGWDEHNLMDEVSSLLSELGVVAEPVKVSYREIFQQNIGLDPHAAPLEALQQEATALSGSDFTAVSRNSCLDLLFSLGVESTLPDGLVFVYDYPLCQAALACSGKDSSGVPVARRFEAFLNRMELANGYYELTDAVEQLSRFESDLALRTAAGKSAMPVDHQLLAAMKSGLPACAGVALGVDRLLMRLLSLVDIREVLPFGIRCDVND
ncbi:EF-P lysine aminoacylase EpmA [uncultured Porticoccus sp.]|uniref:EF-P lysine aminoacylase EpmA n=1 Tax=uncultured Porticoccus sp. TaxID=1256050 RepID=UPI0030D8C1E0|tara:strand:- start:1029 stop:1985 length:957 start_codon:yes stop_codon:yes gene_type:complete